MLSVQQIRDNMGLFLSISEEETKQICSIVLDSLQFKTNLKHQIEELEIEDSSTQLSTRQTLADTILSFVMRILQSRSAISDCSDILTEYGLDSNHVTILASIINSRLDALCKDLVSQSTGDRLTDLEWRFGLTAASNSGSGTPFVQMRLAFESYEPVSVEMGMTEFYEFAADMKRIQSQMSDALSS